MEPINVDCHGWINPTCPYCECVMEFNYCSWWKNNNPVNTFPNLNMYCRRCHYAVHIKPSIVNCENPEEQEDPSFERYNSPQEWTLYKDVKE